MVRREEKSAATEVGEEFWCAKGRGAEKILCSSCHLEKWGKKGRRKGSAQDPRQVKLQDYRREENWTDFRISRRKKALAAVNSWKKGKTAYY